MCTEIKNSIEREDGIGMIIILKFWLIHAVDKLQWTLTFKIPLKNALNQFFLHYSRTRCTCVHQGKYTFFCNKISDEKLIENEEDEGVTWCSHNEFRKKIIMKFYYNLLIWIG